MIVSLKLLSEFVDLKDISVDQLVHKLTFSGLEVEGVDYLAKAKGLVIGEILEVQNHPDSDHLHILKVDEGEKYGIKTIVCGAPNVKEHLKVIVARIGAVIGLDDVKIEPAVIRGVASEGMCCSLLELGVNKSLLSEKQCSGIEELSDDAPTGEEDVLGYLGLDDVLIDINVLANRSDCLSVYSFAREVAALFDREVNIPTYKVEANKKESYKVSSLSLNCPQFSFRAVYNIKVGPSPAFLAQALRSEGIRPINNIVDIGNYAMLLTGRPLHLYDLNKVKSHEFVVRDDLSLDFVALDEKTYKIENGDIVVTDSTYPLCLGGIMGSLDCAIDENTSSIGIECATFSSPRIRRTSSRLGLSSDSSMRFVKGIHPDNDIETIELVSHLLKNYASATEFEPIVTYDVRNKASNVIECSYSYINNRLGTHIEEAKMDEVFSRLDIKIKKGDGDTFEAYPPAHRIDLKCDADLCEEIFRFIGLEEIEPTLPLSKTIQGGYTYSQKMLRSIREHLVDFGLNEVLTYTLVSLKTSLDCTPLTLNNNTHKILNPLTVEHSVVRKGLISSLLDTLIYNQSHQNDNIAIFETSAIETVEENFTCLGIVLNGSKSIQGELQRTPYSFYDLKGIFDSLLAMLGIAPSRLKINRLNDEHFHPGRSVEVMLNKKRIAVYGALHPLYQKEKGISDTYVLELNLSELLAMRTSPLKMAAISKYPTVKRDYAFVLKRDVLCEDIITTIRKKSSELIKDVTIFDVYEGGNMAPDYKSVAIRLTYASNDHTLKDEEINEAEKKVLLSLTSLGAEIRKG